MDFIRIDKTSGMCHRGSDYGTNNLGTCSLGPEARMDLKQLVRYPVSIAARQSVVEIHDHVPVASPLRAAEVLSINAAGPSAAGAATMRNIRLAMMYWLGCPESRRLSAVHNCNV
jgi:hypothetical protein